MKFGANKQELTNRRYSVKSRLRLLQATVTPTVLYGSEAWTLTKEMQQKLQRSQRRMLRLLVGTPRRTETDHRSSQPREEFDDERSEDAEVDVPAELAAAEAESTTESWIQWVQRATHEANELLDKLHIEDWVTTWRRRVWKFAGAL
eukprot:7065207-Karenia_brevis.AAC.1